MVNNSVKRRAKRERIKPGGSSRSEFDRLRDGELVSWGPPELIQAFLEACRGEEGVRQVMRDGCSICGAGGRHDDLG
jgi:hypothetical protein